MPETQQVTREQLEALAKLRHETRLGQTILLRVTKSCFAPCIKNPEKTGIDIENQVCFENCVRNYIDSHTVLNQIFQELQE